MSSNTTTTVTSGGAPHQSEEYDVAIIGHGPSGVIAANLLGKEGVRTLVIERDKDLYSRARAVTVNDWTLRIFQDLGIDEKVKLDMDPLTGVNWKTYAGKTVLSFDTPPSVLNQPPMTSIYQPLMEADLRSVGRAMPSLDIRYGHSFESLAQDVDGVTLNVTDEHGTPYTARAKYVIGADGGQSRVRDALGVELEGATKSRRWIIIDGQVLTWWRDCNTLNMWCDPKRPMVDIPLAKGNHRWELPLLEGESQDEFADEAAVWKLLEPLGMDSRKVRIKGWAFYSHHVRHASTWRVGRVVLVGDAAHLMPPWAGQGMQSGIRDSANIAWKLALVTRGLVGDSILDTVETERWPHVKIATQTSTTLGMVVEATERSRLMLRDHLLPNVMKIPGLNGKFAQQVASPEFQVTAGWLTGPSGRRSAIGRMMPQPMVFDREAITRRLDDVVGYGFTVYGLDADPRTAMSAEQVADWTRLGARFVAVHATDVTPGPDAGDLVIDHTGALRTWFKRYRCRVAAVRPDHFVAATDSGGLDVPVSRPLHPLRSATDRTPQEIPA